MYRMNVWTCVHVSVHIQSWCEIMLLLKPAGPWFSLWGLTVPSGQEEENVFFAGTQCCSVWLTLWGRPWPAVQVESLGSWIHVHQCTLILYIAACTQRREHSSSLLLSYGCTLHLYSFRDLCQQFYILDKCIWMLIEIKKFCSLACALHAAFLCCKIMWWWFYFNFMNPNMK